MLNRRQILEAYMILGGVPIKVSFFSTNRESFDAINITTDEQYAPAEGPAVEEAGIVALPDGRLFALMRSSTGHPVWSVSSDCVKHWNTPYTSYTFQNGTGILWFNDCKYYLMGRKVKENNEKKHWKCPGLWR